MLTVLLIGALVCLLVVLGRESDAPRMTKVVEIIDIDEDDKPPTRDVKTSPMPGK